MVDELDEETRQEVAAFLPVVIRKTLQSYEEFIELSKSENSKDFSNYHSACKAAISHLEMLIKLAQLIGVVEKNDDPSFKDMLRLAEERVRAHEKSR